MRSRWWASALAAAAAFGIARLFVPEAAALFGALPFLVIAAVVAWRETRSPRGARLESALARLQAMTWEEFARALEHGYRREGYDVRPGRGAADFELERSAVVSLVSARRWKAARTGIEPLKDLAATARDRGARSAIYVCAGELTENARAFAGEASVQLLEGGELVRLARGG
ncbi:MAG: restriction endonuclease [Burkholderiales bacterium]